MKNNIFKKIFCIFLIFILTFNFLNVFGASSSGEIIENFTKKQHGLIFESNLSNIDSEYGDIFGLSRKIDVFTNLAEKIKDSREKIEINNKINLNRITNLEESKKIIEEDIKNTLGKIKDLTQAQTQLKSEISANEKKIEVLKKKVEKSKEILLNYIEYIYKKGNTSYSGEQIDNLKSIILNNDDISELINDLYFTSLIQITGKKLMDKHIKYIGELYIQRVDLENKKVEFKKIGKELRIEYKNLTDKRKFKERLLEITKNKQKEYEKIIKDKLKTENKLKEITEEQNKKIKEIRDKILAENGCVFVDFNKNLKAKEILEKTNKKCFNINNIIFLESQLGKEKNELKNPMEWPVIPSRGISAYFREFAYKKELGAEHNAIDIRAKQGSDLRASMSGYVIYINPPTSKDYSFLAIKHPYGYTTVYGHLSEINVKLYEYVEKGQIIGKTGGEYGTNGAGFLTTGPHLHFEVFKDKQYIDPLDVLNISYLNYNNLPLNPAKYKIKYFEDFKERKGYEPSKAEIGKNLFRLIGENEIERQKYLISKYASGSFNNYQLWVDQSLLGNIDPSVTMCIGLAESGLGRNLTTAYNVGNVGNNDRGDRRPYANARDGIGAIVRTLNNKFFKDINRLDMLSGAGRITSSLPSCKEKACYATDPKYWHPNVITCLSHLKGRIVEDDYNFRIIK